MKEKSPGRPQHPGRLDLNINPEVRGKVVEEATARGVSLNEVVNERLARSFGLDPSAVAVPRKAPGRRPAPSKGAAADKPPKPRGKA